MDFKGLLTYICCKIGEIIGIMVENKYTVALYELCHEKTNVLVSDLVRGCTATEDGYRLELSDLGSRGIVLSV